MQVFYEFGPLTNLNFSKFALLSFEPDKAPYSLDQLLKHHLHSKPYLVQIGAFFLLCDSRFKYLLLFSPFSYQVTLDRTIAP